MTPADRRPVFVLRLRAAPGVDPVRALRAALKVLLRRFGLKAIEVAEEPPAGHPRADA